MMMQTGQEEELIKEQFKDTLSKMRNYNNPDDIPEELRVIFDIWKIVFSSNIRIYSIISQELFNTNYLEIDQHDEDLTTIQRNIDLLRGMDFEPVDKKEEWDKFLLKIEDHIELVRVQVNKIYESVQIAESSIEVYKSNLKSMNEEQNAKIKLLKNKTEKQLNKSKSIQKDFIAILGIFASILVAAFGGLSTLTSIFNNINKVPTGKLLFFGSFLVLAIIMIVFLLLNGISKLSDLNLRSCGCGPDDICECSVARKHPTLFILTILLLLTALIGASEYVIDYPKLFSKMSDGITFFILLLVIGLISICCYFYFHDTSKKYTNF